MPAKTPTPHVPKSIRDYYDRLTNVENLIRQQNRPATEGELREAFQVLIGEWGKPKGLTLISEMTIEAKSGKNRIRPDGVLLDSLGLRRGLWEAKDSKDDLEKEIKSKIASGYHLTNTLFEDTRRAVLYQDGKRRLVCDDTRNPVKLQELLETFIGYTTPQYDTYHKTVASFRTEIPNLAASLTDLMNAELDRRGSPFKAALETFLLLCQTSLNPDTTQEQVLDMLKQHMLIERIFRMVFDNPDFVRRNAVAVELEKVVASLTSQHFSRDEFSRKLERFYRPIEETARTITDYSEKQDLLNGLYERFFQAYSVKTADTHGIVYTPQAIVKWMVSSVEAALRAEFELDLGSPGVHIIDPCVGTGNFVMELLRHISTADLENKYDKELHANEVQLLPYYIAAQNIEHAYYERTGQYKPFVGLCFTDTLDLVTASQLQMFAPENSQRVKAQKEAPIRVVIGNPPYNAKQESENDNNKNRKYGSKNKNLETIDRRVSDTYAAASKASNKNALSDPYVKFFRWATDRLGERDGVVCFVSNNSFIDQIAFDGMRQHLLKDFSRIYTFDLGGNVRKNTKLSGTKHNVFGIQVGVAITLLIRNSKHTDHQLYYTRLDEFFTRYQKLAELEAKPDYTQTAWQTLTPDNRNTWLTAGLNANFDTFIAMGTKADKAPSAKAQSIFKTYSNGVKTNRDDWAYDYDQSELGRKIKLFIETYNSELDRWARREDTKISVDSFVKYDDKAIKWGESLKNNLARNNRVTFNKTHIRQSLYRPFCQQFLYFDRALNERVYGFPSIFPTAATEQENTVIAVTGTGWSQPFATLVASQIVHLQIIGNTQCFPLYVYDEDGTNRRDNITDWALHQFQTHYGDLAITKLDIFYYVYGVLHAPAYRTGFAENLKRDLPRIPFVDGLDNFKAYTETGKRLADLHRNYASVTPYRLRSVEKPDVARNWEVDEGGMRLSKDRTTLYYNDWLTLEGIPAKAFEYRLGNRSALEWVIDQYRVSTDARSGLKHDPNQPDAPQAIVQLVGRVIAVSLQTLELIEGLPALF